ncbi:PHD finger-containing protein 1 isoform X1 [Nicotiana tomentosiformis]|uniref:PHD finger-containing protein 1 isoform X1 n=1 Tax=Nicotiana tomentosiformis TaxID=4098 RepID=UPI00051B5BD6|nr:uncharacterized protein LOC104109165 isoform X1 [Nicotiana tomentosiformis]
MCIYFWVLKFLPTMATICLQCGDKGFSNAFVFCVECLEVAVHRYCLNKIPETFDEYVCWVCDDCEAKVPKHIEKCPEIDFVEHSLLGGDSEGRKISEKEKCDPTYVIDKKDVTARVISSSEQLQARTDCIERTQLTDLSPLPTGIDCSPAEMVGQRLQPCISEQPREANTQLDAMGDCSVITEKGSIFSSNDCHGRESKRDRRSTPENRTALNGDASQSLKGELPKDFIHGVHEQAQPVYDPIWRGGFNIWNKKYEKFGGLVAHLSVKACQKVFEEAKLFPPLLRLEMLPKSDIWPKSFNTSEPSDDNIAMYFFPLDARHVGYFDHLVEEMIGEQLALRAVVTNAELLVFTSTELPLLHWRFQGKHYLWGIFRAKQDSSSSQMVSNGIKSMMLQTPGNVLDVRDKINLVKAKSWGAESPMSPLSNSASLASSNS